MYSVNLQFEKLEHDDQLNESDIMDLVPLTTLTGCRPYFEYLKESNDWSALNTVHYCFVLIYWL